MSDTRKEAILSALDAFVRQRAGMDPRDYGDWRAYRNEAARVTRDLHNYRELAAYVARSSITADDLLAAARDAFSGRLKIEMRPADVAHIDYCTGQYFPTEYRRAACAVLASAIWQFWRERVMPAPTTWRVESWSRLGEDRERSKPMQINAACALLAEKGGQDYGYVQEYVAGKTPGDWLRSNARREFSRSIAKGYFS